MRVWFGGLGSIKRSSSGDVYGQQQINRLFKHRLFNTTTPIHNTQPQEAQEGPKPKRAARTNLAAYTAEQKQERRKERARVYSAIARERQEQHMKELKLRVESLTVYKVCAQCCMHGCSLTRLMPTRLSTHGWAHTLFPTPSLQPTHSS